MYFDTVFFYLAYAVSLVGLAQQRYFDDPDFISYLSYLFNYFTELKYRIFLEFPGSLVFLAALQHRAFRESLKSETTILHIHEQQFLDWKNS